MLHALDALLIAYLPGALVFRLPWWNRERRAGLSADERVFWHVILSAGWSVSAVLALAAFDAYRFERLLLLNGAVALICLALGRQHLHYRGAAARWTPIVLFPLILIALGTWRFFPPSEYVIGGKDPGTYMNQGIQLAQRGTMTIREPVVAAVPEFARDLFFPRHPMREYYSTRFMGFSLRDPSTGETTGQFPQFYPASIALGYGVHGVTGARQATGVWAILGLLAVYFSGARLLGRPAALAATILLSLNVIEVWYSRYPNSEIAMQPLLFSAVLAFARAHQDDDPFFGPVSGSLAGLMLFVRIEALPVVLGFVATGILCWLVKLRGPRVGFAIALAACVAVAWPYYRGPILPYTIRLFQWFDYLSPTALGAALSGLGAVFLVLLWMRRRFAGHARRYIPDVVAATVILLGVYAAWLREPGGKLAAHDAYALRTFTQLYLLWTGLAAALVGAALVIRRHFWRDPALLVIFAGMSLFFFYKMKIVPTEFWAARRWVPITLPGALLLAAAAGLGPATRWVWARRIAGAVVILVLGYAYTVRAGPVFAHVEYAGVIPALERLAASFTDRDLVLVESRDAGSDTHVLAMPLAYVYAKNVLVLNSARPDKLKLRHFLEQALTKYRRVYFIGGGGTDLLSRQISARAVQDAKIKVPEFEEISSTQMALPSAVRRKDFDYSVYELAIGEAAQGPFALDVGSRDDLHVLRFNAKETADGRTIRWTAARSVVAIPGMTGTEREVVLVMHDGGRPASAGPARVDVYLDNVLLGEVAVGRGFQPYRFAIPASLAGAAARTEDPALLTLVSSVWSPQQLIGGGDTRTLGVMLDTVNIQ